MKRRKGPTLANEPTGPKPGDKVAVKPEPQSAPQPKTASPVAPKPAAPVPPITPNPATPSTAPNAAPIPPNPAAPNIAPIPQGTAPKGPPGSVDVIGKRLYEEMQKIADQAKQFIESQKDLPDQISGVLKGYVQKVVTMQEQYAMIGVTGDQRGWVDGPQNVPDYNAYGRRAQQPGAVGDVFKVVYNDSKVTYQTYDQMITEDPHVDFCLSLLKGMIKEARFVFSGEDKTMVEWAQKSWDDIADKALDAWLLALDYGWSPVEVIWGRDKDGMTIPIKFADMDPTYCYPVQDWKGDVIAVEQQFGGRVVQILGDKLAEFSYRARYGKVYGRSQLRSSYAFWWAKRFTIQFMQVWIERFAIPWFLMRYPDRLMVTTRNTDGTPAYADPATIAVARGNQARGQSAVALPSTRDQHGELEWDMEQKTTGSSTSGSNPYRETLTFFDDQITQGIFGPSTTTSAVPQDQGGSTIAKSHKSSSSSIVNGIGENICELIETIYNRRLRFWNFGPKSPELSVSMEPVGDDMKSKLWTVFDQMQKSGGFRYVGVDGVEVELDPEYIAKELGLKMRKAMPKPGGLPVIGPDGLPVLGPDGQPLRQPPPNAPPTLGPDGKPIQPAQPKLGPVPPTPSQFEAEAPVTPPGPDPLKQFRRDLFPWEQRYGMLAFKSLFDNGAADFGAVVGPIVGPQIDDIVKQVSDAWLKDDDARMKALENISVKFGSRLNDAIESFLISVIDKTLASSSRNFRVNPLDGKTGLYAWASATASTISSEEVRAVRTAAVQSAISSAVREESSRAASTGAMQSAETAEQDWEATVGAIAVASAVNLANSEQVDQDPNVEFAAWSALLDNVVCKLCEWRDGQVIRTDSADFKAWEPPIHFGPCRCIWVPLKGTDYEETWVSVVPASLMKLYQLESKPKRKANDR